MKIDKFDYKNIKNIILETVDSLDDDHKIKKGSFTSNYFSKDFVDIKKDISILKEELKKNHNIDLTEFFQKYNDNIYDDLDFTGSCAFVDCLLYFYDKEKGNLGGLKLEDSDKCEFVIKYKYGYYNYDMGKRFILQSYDTMEDYYKATAENFLYGILYSSYENFNITNSSLDEKTALDIIEKCSLIKKYPECYTIYIHLKCLQILLSYNNVYTGDYSTFIDDFKDDIYPINHSIFENILQIYIGEKRHKTSFEEHKEIFKELNDIYELESEIINFNL